MPILQKTSIEIMMKSRFNRKLIPAPRQSRRSRYKYYPIYFFLANLIEGMNRQICLTGEKVEGLPGFRD
jgi:hypothetical protein